ncbi:Chromate resistance protein ChrB [Dietzia maris]|uniref:Chromate resistance protein ChrB n=1 Tax=Dietzia maris TaxID=37915 RepID=UPI0019D43502|nr:Chromate resistance protein ChrB [Dietzia maris]MCT1434321.1 chromate resistance protein [Dietzia maris]MCT1521277.1 chromate resistance protein [Dietzia maris]
MNDATSATRSQWVLLSYRLPREPSTPRIALWRKLKKLGVAQFADNVVALPDDARSREHLEWLADEVLEWGGQAGIWIASATTQAQELHLIEQMRNARAAEYAELTAQAAAALHATEDERVASLRRLRNQWRQITRRDYFPPPERTAAHTALRQLASPDAQTADHTQTENTQTKESL